jgi:hypothetical protein
MISIVLQSVGSLIAVAGIVTCFFDFSIAILIGSTGWMIGSVAVVMMIEDNELRRNRESIADHLAIWDFCPQGYTGGYQLEVITSRCKDACYPTCSDCILKFIGGTPRRHINLEETNETSLPGGRDATIRWIASMPKEARFVIKTVDTTDHEEEKNENS